MSNSKSSPPKVALTDTIVELSVPSFAPVKEFYSKLGFKLVWEEPPYGLNGYLVMELNNSILCFFCGNEYVYKHPYFKQYPTNTKRGYGVEISIPITDIESYYSKITKSVPNNVFQPLKLQPWGKKDFRLEDCFGYFLRFNEPWNVTEYLPLESNYLPLS